MLAMPSHAISCTPIPPWSPSKCRNTPSTNQLHVSAFQVGRSVWPNKDYCLKTSSFSSKIFWQGGNAWNLFDFDNQSAAIFCVETIKYYYIPSVPSGLEEVKTRPQGVSKQNRTSKMKIETKKKQGADWRLVQTCSPSFFLFRENQRLPTYCQNKKVER